MPPDKSIVHVIDDDKAVRQALAFQLGSAGIEVRTYESAVAFLEVAPTVHTGHANARAQRYRPVATIAGAQAPPCRSSSSPRMEIFRSPWRR